MKATKIIKNKNLNSKDKIKIILISIILFNYI